MRTWVSCKPQKTWPACTHWSTTILSQKTAADASRDSWEEREFYQAKIVKMHCNNLVVLTHVQLKSFYRLSTHDVTHVRKCTRLSPTLPYCKQWEAGGGPGNKASVS